MMPVPMPEMVDLVNAICC